MTAPVYIDVREYETLYLNKLAARIRSSAHNTIRSGPGTTIVRSYEKDGGYQTFRIVESGLEIPIANVANAVPKGASMATKLRKTTEKGLTPKLVKPKKKPIPPPTDLDEGDE